MDPEISIMLQCPFREGITEDRVQVEISPKYNRRQLQHHEPKIEATWRERCRENPWLFNGAKFRIHSARLEKGKLTFRLGLTCYKDFIGTNWSSEAVHLQQKGWADCGDTQAYLAEPLGVGAMLHTADDDFVFLRRSLQVGEAPGLIDVPGGHPEPKAVAQGIPEGSISHEDLSENLVAEEVFSSILGEIRDEVNIPVTTLSRPILLGIARNNTSAGRPSAEFYVRCSLTSEQVKQCYQIGGPEAQESTNIVFIKREVKSRWEPASSSSRAQRVLELEENKEVWKELCPSAKGGVKLFSLVRPTLG
ncbi:uridine diphosphate glucose pyrophosphatase NUDT22 isoform X1 [Latimeria chalumnae]|uniref:uridine diphosphate glucose pyrophosphatase NUDT22 isoform X1 n=1 Tax=Latimeria chalumnae TaxID=7897 RepID=UPI0006D8EB8F|nr:PREDICTED: nucleoside diphosphate-linked moiety X motif 22 isoform X1 [Latimeria chalumnae]|eukprot:XP_014354566.1 PREDICTED: nucleoside diphosphate-linked moiety X motif 22 isoform X1 [Latimeria chalumnae]